MKISVKITNQGGVKPNFVFAPCTFGWRYSNNMCNFNWRAAR